MTSDGIRVGAETVEGVRWTLQKMLACLDKPILDYETREEVMEHQK